jgi:hypothetical protein
MTSCSSGPSATEAAACSAILKITPPLGMGEPREGTSVGIAISANLIENLIHGDPTLTRYGRAIVSANGRGFVKGFDGAQTEVGWLAPDEPAPRSPRHMGDLLGTVSDAG